MRRLSQQLRAIKATGLEFEAPPLFDKRLAEQLGVAQDLRLLIEHCGGMPKPRWTSNANGSPTWIGGVVRR